MTVATFLHEHLHYPKNALLDRLAGERIGRTTMLPDLAAAREAIAPWMPIFYLPVAATAFGVGLHLRPSDVAAHRLAFCEAREAGRFVESSLSVEQLIYTGLLGQEGYGNSGTKMPASFAPSVAKANELLGAGFYDPGRHGKFFSGDEPRVVLEAFGGTPETIDTLAVLADTPTEKLALWQRGIALGAESLALYAGAARSALELGQRSEAAALMARSLDCYHHTAFEVDLDEHFELGRELLREFPQAFGEDATWQLQTSDPRAWPKRAAELFKAGQVERGDKLLNDTCHGTGDYTAALGAFRQHYQALGWDWALALCELRT